MKDGHKFALGTDTYTLGDVLLTTMMARLAVDSKFFKENVVQNSALNEYWERAQSRPSFKAAYIMVIELPSNLKVTAGFTLVMCVITAIIMGILMIFQKQLEINSLNWFWWALGVLAGVVSLVFTILGINRQRIWNNHLAIVKSDGYRKQ